MPDESSTEPEFEAEVVPAEPTTPPSGPSGPSQPGYTDDGVPTFESVREKIETRYATSIGSAELASETPEGRAAEEQYEARQKAAAERLEQIRQSMGQNPDSDQ